MVYFVSGVDTDAGKSIATGWLAKRFLDEGQHVITQKLVQTGNVDISEDIVRHRAMMGCGMLPEDDTRLTMPEIYTYPCSPHLAARLDNRPIDLDAISAATESLAERYDTVLLEGAGGLMVPLSDDVLTIDYVQSKGYPLIFVTGGILGSINHTLLAFEAMARRNMTVSRIVYNLWPGRDNTVVDAESQAYLRGVAMRLFPDAIWESLPLQEVN